MRVTPQGMPVCQFSLALNHKYTSAGGEKREEVTYVDCEAWSKTAELIAKYLGKGRAALVEGRLKLDSWEDKNTKEKRSRLKVVVESVQFLGSPGERPQPSGQSPERNQPPAQSGGAKPPAAQQNLDEDVPF